MTPHLENFIKNSPNLIPKETVHHRFDSFSISGYPHYENVLSNWFSFFFNTAAEHGFSNLFPEAIKNCLTEKYGIDDLDWLDSELKSEREIITKNKKFIDIIVFDEGDSQSRTFGNCLIIEHKIYADLYNDLNEYHKSISVENQKLGIVLSAKNRDDRNPHFRNISYSELLSSLRTLLGKYQPKANYKYILYLTDLLINMDKLSDNIETSKAVKFCFEYGSEIQRIIKLKEDAEIQLTEQLKMALANSDFEFNKRYPYSFSLRAQNDGISLNVKLEHLFDKNECFFQFWLKGSWAFDWIKVQDISLIAKYCSSKKIEVRPKKENKMWAEIAQGKFIFDPESKLNFGEQFAMFLENDLVPLVQLIIKLKTEATA